MEITEVYHRECIYCENYFETDEITQVWCTGECKKNLYDHICKNCGSLFFSNNKKEKLCLGCKVRNCFECGEEFISEKYINHCSKECRDRYFTSNCKACGESFIDYGQKQKFCDDVCKEQYEVHNKSWRLCEVCKKPFLTFMNQKCCTETCYGKYLAKKRGITNSNRYYAAAKKSKKSTNVNLDELKIIIEQKVDSLIKRREDFLKLEIVNVVDFNDVSGFTDSLKAKILQRDEHHCYVCHKDYELEVHHILPRRLGGTHKENNLITLCVRCHRHIETGDRSHAYKKCLLNARDFYDIPEIKMKEFLDKKTHVNIIINELEKICSNLTEGVEVNEVILSVDDLIDNVLELRMTI
jgi:hypothetical protein